jgi:hypothetical protein
MQTTLVDADVKRVMAKVNRIWAQAGIQFEIESIGPTTTLESPPDLRLKSEYARVKALIPASRLSATAIDVCYVKEIGPNGFYSGGLIVVKDTAQLGEVSGGIDEPLPRVTAHELGHALGLKHRQESTNLMQSGKTGFLLNAAEIAIARSQGEEMLKR